MTPEEKAVVEALVAAWNAYIALPGEHADDDTEFRHGIHALQHMILARPERRALKKEKP